SPERRRPEREGDAGGGSGRAATKKDKSSDVGSRLPLRAGVGQRQIIIQSNHQLPEKVFSLSSLRGGEGRGEEANSIECPSPRPSPHSFLAGRGRDFLMVVSRCDPPATGRISALPPERRPPARHPLRS